MLPLLPLFPSVALFSAAAFLAAVSLRFLHGAAWRWTRMPLACALGMGALGHLCWAIGVQPALGVRVAWTTNVLLVPLAGALLLGGALQLPSVIGRGRAPLPMRPPARGQVGGPAQRRPQVTRRSLMQAAAAGLPAVALAGSVRGLTAAGKAPGLPVVRMSFPDLHPDLEGFTILQLSDLHLGTALRVADLRAFFARLGSFVPDLVVLTGDVADDNRELEQALALVAEHPGRFGAFAVLGNHEYLHDIEAVRPIFARGAIPLLVDRGAAVRVGEATLWVAGADDPMFEHGPPGFYQQAVERCAAEAPEASFRLLLSHRPDAFPFAADRGFDLTLSGHTHGGQLGLFGRSAVERLMPYAWGSYRRGSRRLYTTSGFGHWFPFRLQCPTEAPLIVLTRSA